MSRICPKRVTGIKTFQTRIKMKVKTNETQGVSDLSKKHQRNKNNGNAYENESKNNEINVSRICPKSVTGMKTFQKRMKLKLFISLEGELLLRPAGP